MCILFIVLPLINMTVGLEIKKGYSPWGYPISKHEVCPLKQRVLILDIDQTSLGLLTSKQTKQPSGAKQHGPFFAKREIINKYFKSLSGITRVNQKRGQKQSRT